MTVLAIEDHEGGQDVRAKGGEVSPGWLQVVTNWDTCQGVSNVTYKGLSQGVAMKAKKFRQEGELHNKESFGRGGSEEERSETRIRPRAGDHASWQQPRRL